MRLSWSARWRCLLTGQIPTPSPVLPFRKPSFLHYSTLSLSDWRRSDERVRWARELFETPYFRELLAVLANTRPSIRLDFVTDDAVAAHITLGMRLGHDQLFGVLLSLAEFPDRPMPDVEADYGAASQELP